MARGSARTVGYAANPLLQVRMPAYRSGVMLALIAFAFMALAVRATYLQAFSDDYLREQGESRYGRTLILPASRGKILDRNGNVLAASLPAYAVWADPDQTEAKPEELHQLGKLLNLRPKALRGKLNETDRSLVYLRRQLDPAVADKVRALKLPGINLQREYKRHYPEGETVAHIVGFTNVDDLGQEGIELARNRQLAGQTGSRRVIKDRLGRIIEDVRAVREPHDGDDIVLSIDAKMQFLAFDALRDAVQDNKAKAGAVVVLDVVSGEILALANWPTYNPNQRARLSGAQLRNRVITDTFEPGSTMKPFTAALALELGKAKPLTVFQTAPGKLTIGSATIGDAHPHGALTLEEVIEKSSNVGIAKLALQMEPKEIWEFYAALGFGQVPQLGFPGAVAGRVRPYRSWRPIEQATMSYGHGMSVSLIQVARAYLAFARDGELLPLSITRRDAVPASTRVISKKTALAVRKMLEMAAGPNGTAPRAQIAGYRVAGKTGTALKIENGKYVKKYVASFVGFAPVSAPRIVVAAMIDEPNAGRHYGGDVAAPLFARVAGEAMRALQVEPDAPGVAVVIPTTAVQESM